MAEPAARVRLAPQEARSEDQLVQAVRDLPTSTPALRPGDAVGDLVVLAVEPQAGLAIDPSTQIDITPTPRPLTGATVHLTLVIDTAASMALPWGSGKTRLEAAATVAQSVLGRVVPGLARVSLVRFAKDTDVLAGPVAPIDVKLPSLAAKGSSRLGKALDDVLAHLTSDTLPEQAQAIILLTDSGSEPSAVEAAAARAARLHVPVHIVVFAPEIDPLLETLATASGGSAQVATLPLELDFVHEDAA